ncbi:hypothetical protein CAMGR0001_0556 [Campylobacter gracilis RM3268]|uniref:Uncharacterized protein n=1 Tax=Campylobacter gracilis RM3268 TaxID=553220 RepID=C8PHW0_9BACT|nr:hypothetical protein CAMGR0001_0556 [Campylobacter gracilis RM3268]
MIYAIAVKFMRWGFEARFLARRGDVSWDLQKTPYKTSVLRQNIKIILNL